MSIFTMKKPRTPELLDLPLDERPELREPLAALATAVSEEAVLRERVRRLEFIEGGGSSREVFNGGARYDATLELNILRPKLREAEKDREQAAARRDAILAQTRETAYHAWASEHRDALAAAIAAQDAVHEQHWTPLYASKVAAMTRLGLSIPPYQGHPFLDPNTLGEPTGYDLFKQHLIDSGFLAGARTNFRATDAAPLPEVTAPVPRRHARAPEESGPRCFACQKPLDLSAPHTMATIREIGNDGSRWDSQRTFHQTCFMAFEAAGVLPNAALGRKFEILGTEHRAG